MTLAVHFGMFGEQLAERSGTRSRQAGNTYEAMRHDCLLKEIAAE